MSTDVSAAILAGGRAARFGGRDKSAIVVEGRTILERQIDALAPIAGEILIVGRGTHPAARTIPDRVEGCGPMGGLDAALSAARGDLVVVVACDMPFVTTALLTGLVGLAGGAGDPGGIDAVVPRTERGYHPLCAVYRRSVLGAVERHLARGRLKMRDLLAELRVTFTDVDRFGDCHRLLANVNTPADLEGHEP